MGAELSASNPTNVSDGALFASLDLDRPGLEKVRAAVAAGDFQAAAHEWAAYFRARKEPTPHFRRETWPAFIRREFPQLAAPMIAAADKVARGDLSHPPFALQVNGRKINWLANPTKDTNYVSVVGSQWLLNPLGRAYLLTGDEKYAEAFAWFFESWYDSQDAIVEFAGGIGINPIYRAYYPGIRCRILVDNYYCIARSPALSARVHVKLMKQLLASASWLFAQEQRYRPGNQQVGAVVGLGIVGIVFPEFRDANQWVSCAQQRMKEHLRRDFFPDGGHMELCTQYHKTCLRDMGYVSLTAERNGRPSLFSSDAAPQLEKAYEWLSRIVMPTGETPALHSAAFSTDWAVHLLIAARYFKRGDFLWQARRFWEGGIAPNQKAPFAFPCYMICESLSAAELTHVAPAPPDCRSVLLAESGFAIMRTGWDANDSYLAIQYGWANSGHAYPAALAFCLEMNGDLVATNPGSPLSYRHPAYAYCHSTPAHNVVSIDMASYRGKSGIAPGGKLLSHMDAPGAWYVRARHEGYKQSFGALHERSILALESGPVLIHDVIRGGEKRVAHWNFHTPLDLNVDEDRRATLKGNRLYRLCPALPDRVDAVKTERRWETVLPRDCQPTDCGKLVNVLRYEKRIGPEGAAFTVALVQGEGAIEALGENAFRVRTGDSEYVVLFADAGSVKAGDVSTEAECACVRLSGGKPQRAWVVKGKRLVISETEWLNSTEPVSGEIKRRR